MLTNTAHAHHWNRWKEWDSPAEVGVRSKQRHETNHNHAHTMLESMGMHYSLAVMHIMFHVLPIVRRRENISNAHKHCTHNWDRWKE